MPKFLFAIILSMLTVLSHAQNVGIGTKIPTEKLNVDSGNIRIGKAPWTTATNSSFLKFGDIDYVTIGEEEGDDKLTIRAKELILRPSFTYSTFPLSIQGSTNYSHFNYGTNEDTYLRGGKDNSSVIINDIVGAKVGIGMSNPTRAMLEQYGAVVNTTAIFGGDGQGISLQQNWPAIGFNHYYNGASRSIGAGWGGQLAMNPGNGTLQWSTTGGSYQTNQASNLTTVVSIDQQGKIGVGRNNISPTAYLHIFDESSPSGSALNKGIRLDNTSSTTGIVTSWNIYNQNRNPGVHSLTFASNGNDVSQIAGGDGSYFQLSDQRSKKEIQPLDSANLLNKIMQLAPVSYRMISENNGDKKKIGFLSQEIDKIFPELTRSNGDLLLMNYSGLIPILTKGIQEQQHHIEVLQKENASMKLALAELKKLVLEKK